MTWVEVSVVRLRISRTKWALAVCAAGFALNGVTPSGATIGTPCSGVRPGAVLVVPLTPPIDPRPYPTFGFMFTGGDGRTYASTAGHVALGLDSGERSWADGNRLPAFDSDGDRIGEFVYAINTRPAPEPDLPPGADLALIRLDEDVAFDPSVCGIGGPYGLDDRVIDAPEIVEHRWFGVTVVGGRVGHPLPEGPWLAAERAGVSIGMPSEHVVSVIGHASFGDSGGPVLNTDALAVGLISGPPTSPEELTMGGAFVVSRLSPAIARAEQVLETALTLATVLNAPSANQTRF